MPLLNVLGASRRSADVEIARHNGWSEAHTHITMSPWPGGPERIPLGMVAMNTAQADMIRQALVDPQEFSPAGWAESVAYPDYSWKRVSCDRWC